MTPAEELRAAATKLRETASKATPGPWEHTSTQADGIVPRWILGAPTDPNDAWSAADVIAITSEMTEKLADITEPDRLISDGDMDWIALVSPALAEPLAAWLDAVADEIEYSQRCGEWVSPKHPALAVARALNGDPR